MRTPPSEFGKNSITMNSEGSEVRLIREHNLEGRGFFMYKIAFRSPRQNRFSSVFAVLTAVRILHTYVHI